MQKRDQQTQLAASTASALLFEPCAFFTAVALVDVLSAARLLSAAILLAENLHPSLLCCCSVTCCTAINLSHRDTFCSIFRAAQSGNAMCQKRVDGLATCTSSCWQQYTGFMLPSVHWCPMGARGSKHDIVNGDASFPYCCWAEVGLHSSHPC